MCKTIEIRATLDDGVTPHPDMPDSVIFESPDKFTPDKPTCTCWIGDKDGDGMILRQTFVEEFLRPFLKKISWGNIIIEIR